MKRLSASKLDLAFECLHWTALDFDEPPAGRAAVMGTAFHDCAATGFHSQELTSAEQEAHEKRWRGWLKHGLPLVPDQHRAEVAYALSPDGTIRELGENIGREYDAHGAGPDDICGSVDVVTDDRVVDYKTGQPVTAAEHSWQLRFAAIVADVPRAEFHYVSEAGRVKVDRADYPPGAQQADFESLVELAANKRSGNTPPRYGEHCDRLYCPARTVCGKYREVMGPLVAAPAKIQKKETRPMAFNLNSITKGKKQSPYYVVLYGPEGIGKSSFAAGAPSPIFLGEPGGTDHLDIARFPAPQTLEDIESALDSLEKERHDFQTLVIDTADYLEPVIWESICREAKVASIEKVAGGFGKGYVFALDKWRELAGRFERLIDRGMHVVILAHSHLKTVKNPLGDDYEHYEMKLNGKAAAFLKERPKAVLFANYVSYTDKDETTKRVKAYGDGSRLIYTEHRPAYDAKNRYGLPAELPLSWEDFDAAARAGIPANAEKLATEIETLLGELPTERVAKVRAALDSNRNDAAKLSALADRVRGIIRNEKAA
jgi:hypothetical protein